MENSTSFPHFNSSNNNNKSVYFFQDMTKLKGKSLKVKGES